MPHPSLRDKVAFALFDELYTGDPAEPDDPDWDPATPQRHWDSLTDEQKGPWYRWADKALAAIADEFH